MNQKNKWIVAISNTYNCNITLLYLTATVEEVKQYLMNRIEQEKEDSFEMCTDCTESIEDIKQYIDTETKQTIELYAYLCFSTYRINYSAQPLDLIPDVTDSEKMVVKIEV